MTPIAEGLNMKKRDAYTVAVVGATGAVGTEMIAVLEQRNFPVGTLKPFASERSVGKSVEFRDDDVAVEALTCDSFTEVDIALFSAGGAISKEFCPIAAEAGALVIDNSSVFRMDDDIPLVVPEVNSDACKDWQQRGIIANPNCSTIQLCVALKPLHDAVGLKRVVVSTYQATSGAGQQAMDEMVGQVRALFQSTDPISNVFPHTIAFNCLPHIDAFLENGYTKEEWKMMTETQKILGLPDLKVTATAVRVPVFVGHSESVNVETQKKLTADDARSVLRESPGIMIIDEPKENLYPLARDIAGTDAVYIGRIRNDASCTNGLDMWVVADNLRKGAALNAVQIAEIVTSTHL
jgi:aspartate-semialdehyde dehydrogenase